MLVRRAACAALAAACFTVPHAGRPVAWAADPIGSLQSGSQAAFDAIAKAKQQADADAARAQQIRDSAAKPDAYGKFGARPEAPVQTPRVINFRGQLEPESEDDATARYSNPYAARLAYISEEAARKRKAPEMPTAPVRRDGFLSVKPNNMACDANGRNCKFVGPTGTVAPSPLEDEVPAGKFLREDLEMLKQMR